MGDSFFERLHRRAKEVNSLLCVGLDPHGKQLPEATAAAAEKHSLDLIAATSEYAACFKPNAAFFEAFGAEGLAALQRVVAAAKASGALVLLDNKRGDIGTTSDAYAIASFDSLGADAVTLSPYMGWDTLDPFVNADKSYGATHGAFVLCKTSNASSSEMQSLRIATGGRTVFERVAELTVPGQAWNKHSNVGLVVGATDVAAISAVRRCNTEAWILAPGVGAQGGDLEACCRAAIRDDGYGLLLPISRGISAAADPAAAAQGFRDAINAIRTAVTESASKKGKSGGGSELLPYQSDFIRLSLSLQALRFGEFTLKSGRLSPYFFNAGLFCTGRAQAQLAAAYAECISTRMKSSEYDIIFGPAYKGIPLAAGVASALYLDHGKDVGFAYNRKEAKDHGEGGTLVGSPVAGKKCLLVDDVISAGTAIREAKGILDAAGAILAGICVALDRQERTGKDDELSELSAIQVVQKECGVPVVSIIGLSDLLSFLELEGGSLDLGSYATQVSAYQQRYGVLPGA
mmetsp:Transcript_12432/g.29280  ORF Transcript_12432/g.29280 Transcript_12432/m.29280 type:complete len:518 (-) Transcript_12432:129-1682(-)